MNNDPSLEILITTLSGRFKMLTSMVLRLLTNEVYSVKDVCCHQSPAQYVRAIMHHGLGCNIIDIANQLLFVYRDLISELRVFITSLTDTTKVIDFI